MSQRCRVFGRVAAVAVMLMLVDRPAFSCLAFGRPMCPTGLHLQSSDRQCSRRGQVQSPRVASLRAVEQGGNQLWSNRSIASLAAVAACVLAVVVSPGVAHATETYPATTAGYIGGINVVGIAAGITLPLVYSFFLEAQRAEVKEKEEAFRRVQAAEGVFSALLPVATVAGIAVAVFTNVGVWLRP
eukprot:CAMPEP_0117491524 /NCGR_PEP_ID=MMETSP0784-20121206/18111_1 /TAXON_ID=39447 /ORGANISM="" /LENGTH=185 /DNA_ID=CAMNT_0005286317 /DNA_START=52 /DNA_END=609 /DNA_ORIENTATION=+